MAKNGIVRSECRIEKTLTSNSPDLTAVESEADRLSRDPRLGVMDAGRHGRDEKRVAQFRSTRVA